MFIVIYLSLCTLVLVLFFLFCVNPIIFGLSEKNQKKFNYFLTNICKKEGILVAYYDDIIDLNVAVYGAEETKKKEPGKLAVGVYSWNNTKKTSRISLAKRISIYNKTMNLMVFAHELGHHYAIKNHRNRSEEMADLISVQLFQKCFSKRKTILFMYFLVSYASFKKIRNTKSLI